MVILFNLSRLIFGGERKKYHTREGVSPASADIKIGCAT